MTRAWMVVVAAGLVGCVPGKQDALEGGDNGDPQGSETSGEQGSSGTEGVGSTTPVTSEDTGSESSSGGGDTCNFICMEPEVFDCDVWAQDCPEGEKCMPWANDGGNAWNSLRCTAVDPNPDQIGDPCTVEGSGVSGMDSCALGAMCWNTDEEGNGTCVSFCQGTEASPVCDDPESSCVIANDGVLILCLPLCDPLLQDCGDGQACYPVNGGFACGPDASGEAGLFGDPCEFLNVCDAGLFCADASLVPGCQGATGCCSPFCDLTNPGACPGQGQECTQWYEEGMVPPGFESVGACIIPE